MYVKFAYLFIHICHKCTDNTTYTTKTVNCLNIDQLDATNNDLLLVNCFSTCFGRLYAHHQEIGLRSTVYGFLSCCSCCDAGESGSEMCALCKHLTTRLSGTTTATTGQKTIGSGTQSDLLMKGVKTLETC